jgi:altronate hydrolase
VSEASVTSPHAAHLDAFAIQVHPSDNVAIVRRALPAGTVLETPAGDLTIKEFIPRGHRFAFRNLPPGELVLQYGQPIGTSAGVEAGRWITQELLRHEVPLTRDLPQAEAPPPAYFPPPEIGTFQGYRRADGRVGTRNYILILPTSMCSSHEAAQISMMSEFLLWNRQKYPNVDGVVATPHNKGCGCQNGSNLEILMRTLAAYAAHPNVGGVVLVDLGCEKTNLSYLDSYLYGENINFQKPVARIGIQAVGGTANAVERGLKAVESLLLQVNEAHREPVSISELILGVKCGASDSFSGISANPALGNAADLIVRSHGTVIATETPEFCGVEHLLARRAKNAQVAGEVYAMVDWYKEFAAKAGAVLNENPSPGNVTAGLLNITIKSLGAIAKAGTTRIEGTMGYAEPPGGKGVWLMQGPGYDQESTPGLVAAGAQVIVFTTGMGSTIGNAVAPVIKLASNTETFQRMGNDINLNAGTILDGTETIPQVGRRVFDSIARVASGEQVYAEQHKHREFQIWGETAVSL